MSIVMTWIDKKVKITSDSMKSIRENMLTNLLIALSYFGQYEEVSKPEIIISLWVSIGE